MTNEYQTDYLHICPKRFRCGEIHFFGCYEYVRCICLARKEGKERKESMEWDTGTPRGNERPQIERIHAL